MARYCDVDKAVSQPEDRELLLSGLRMAGGEID
jgi:hypothetical protein